MLLFSMLLLNREAGHILKRLQIFLELKIMTIFYMKIIFSEVKFKGTFVFKSFKPGCFKSKASFSKVLSFHCQS